MTEREQILSAVRTKLADGVVCMGLDGRSGAGKSTLAELLCAEFESAAVIHMDDFFLPAPLRTPERQAEGNAHFERFLVEVAPHLRSGAAFSYRRFDCAAMDYAPEPVSVPAGRVRIVEGAYTLHPSLRPYYDIAVFCDVTPKLQKARIIERNGPEAWAHFESRWIPLEEAYIRRYRPEDGALGITSR